MLSHIELLELYPPFVSYVALGCSLTSKGSADDHSPPIFQTHHLVSRSPQQLVLLLAYSPIRLDYPSQDIASYYTSTSRMRAASRLGVGHSMKRLVCSLSSFSTSTWRLRTARPTHTNISFPSHTSRVPSCRGTGELTRIAASFTSSYWRILDQS